MQLEGYNFLRDAQGAIALEGKADMFQDFRSGDQVLVQVTGFDGETAHCSEAERVVYSEREWLQAPRLHAAEFAKFVNAVRQFFISRGCNEVFTPTLVPCPGMEPSLEPFSVGRTYLPTSPEIHLKKALARGWTDIFEIKSCFRKGELSAHHEPEFTMLEWYRGFADLEMIIADLKALLEHLDTNGFMRQSAPVAVTTFRKLFHEVLDFELKPEATVEDLQGVARRLSLHSLPDDSFADLFHRLLIEHIEPRMREMGPLVVRDFPPSMAALAKLTAEGWADRCEFYWEGLEIANAFNEVNDPLEQKKRWQNDIEERKRLGTSTLAVDPSLIHALEAGMPPSGGIALGMERLYMACRGVDEIRELKLFATAAPVQTRRRK